MDLLKYENKGNYAIITLNSPSELNALSMKMLKELDEQIAEINNIGELRALIITGAGKAFCAGANIAEMKDLGSEGAKDYSVFGNSVFNRLSETSIPVIAAINGFALGGGLELALACDIRLASNKAKLGFPEVKLGIMPGFGGTQRLPRLIGKSRAMELIFSAMNITAEQAFDYSLVSRVLEPEALLDAACELAERISRNSAIGIRQAKFAVSQGLELDMQNGLDLESEAFGVCFGHEDQKIAMAEFLSKNQGGTK